MYLEIKIRFYFLSLLLSLIIVGCLPTNNENSESTTTTSNTSTSNTSTNNTNGSLENDDRVVIIPSTVIDYNNQGSGNSNGGSTTPSLHPYYLNNPDPEPQQEPDTPDPTPHVFRVAPHIKYYGYFWSALFERPQVQVAPNVFQRGETPINYMDEYQDHTNVSWMLSSQPYLKEQFDLARFYNQKVVIDLSAQIFGDPQGKKGGLHYHEDYEVIENRVRDFWHNFILKNNYQDMILFVTPMDEPYHNFGEKILFWERNEIVKKLNKSLIKIGKIIKRVMISNGKPVKVGITFSPRNASDDNVKLENGEDWDEAYDVFDYLGFYCYGGWDKCHSKRGLAGNKVDYSVKDIFFTLQKKTRFWRQKWYIIPLAFQNLSTGNHNEDSILKTFNISYALAKKESRVFAIFPFIWRSYREGEAPPGEEGPKLRLGARDLPRVRERVIEVGKELVK